MAKNKITILLLVAVFVLGLNSAVASSYAVQTKINNCLANQVLPDFACTPGAVLTMDTKTICTPGYTKTVRDVSLPEKKQVFKEYGIPWSLHANYEVDHLISLELGGSNGIANLWPESFLVKNGSSVKDKFENELHKKVCNGSMTIQEAQKEIATDWLSYYNQTDHKSTKTNNAAVSPQNQFHATNNQKTLPSATATEPAVKKSTTGLCHEKGSTYYSRTLKFTPYNSLKECLDSGGKLPKK